MLTESQFNSILHLLETRGRTKRDIIGRTLNLNPVKIRQAREQALERGIYIVSDYADGFAVAKTSTDFDESIRRLKKMGVSILKEVRQLQRGQMKFREAEGIETPETQLALNAKEEQLSVELQKHFEQGDLFQ